MCRAYVVAFIYIFYHIIYIENFVCAHADIPVKGSTRSAESRCRRGASFFRAPSGGPPLTLDTHGQIQSGRPSRRYGLTCKRFILFYIFVYVRGGGTLLESCPRELPGRTIGVSNRCLSQFISGQRDGNDSLL